MFQRYDNSVIACHCILRVYSTLLITEDRGSGMIDDPYNEFFVEEFGEGCQLEQVQRKYELVYDTYWEKRYSLNIQQVSSQRSASVCDLSCVE